MTTLHAAADAFELGDELVLFAEATGDLFVLNQVAAHLWLGLTGGMRLPDVVDEIAQSFSMPRAIIEQDCRSLMSEWRRLGLLGSVARDSGTRAADTSEPGHDATDDARAAAAVVRSSPTITRSYRLADFAFRLRSGSSEHERNVHDYLTHLAVSDDDDPSTPVLELSVEATLFVLAFEGREIDRCADVGELLPMVHGNLVMGAYRRSPCLLAVHAACVMKGETCILLAGQSGAGKSTLVSALLGEGFDYLSDDTVLLSAPPIRVRGIRMPLCLKEPSWPIVARRWPESAERPVHRRRDGRRVRYWLPRTTPGQASIGRQTHAASALVFSRYSTSGPNAFRRINAAEALIRLTQSGYDTRENLTRDTVRALVEWIADIPCFELEYSDERVAITHLTSLSA